MKKNTIEIRLSPFRKFDKDEKEALESEAARYGKFRGDSVSCMSRLIARATLRILILLVILYIATLVAVNTSIAQEAIQTEVVINASASEVWQMLTDFELILMEPFYP